jgi:hypothetical protein
LTSVNSAKDAAQKLHKLFIEHKTSGYNKNKINLLNEKIKNIADKKEIKDFSQMFQNLKKMAAIDQGKALS